MNVENMTREELERALALEAFRVAQMKYENLEKRLQDAGDELQQTRVRLFNAAPELRGI